MTTTTSRQCRKPKQQTAVPADFLHAYVSTSLEAMQDFFVGSEIPAPVTLLLCNLYVKIAIGELNDEAAIQAYVREWASKNSNLVIT